jgi:D-alanine--poly(phosphoribitol) ligase subunit 1
MIGGDGVRGNSVPIGKPRRNMEMFVRTKEGGLSTAIDAEGELLVRGTSVAYGYLGETIKTDKVFIQNPRHDNFHDPLYCTGDLVRINKNGDFLFLGRADDQIKYLGYRIELGEVESALNTAGGVDEGVVVFNNSDDEQLRAIGALVKLDGSTSIEQLRVALRHLLPPYMVPSKIKLLEGSFPRTANGKYDRKTILSELF